MAKNQNHLLQLFVIALICSIKDIQQLLYNSVLRENSSIIVVYGDGITIAKLERTTIEHGAPPPSH